MGVDALTVRLQAIFTEELDEQLQQLNDDILGLERAPEDGERLRAVFRVMHTLKGASRAAGLPLVEQLCHAIEERLSRVRDGGAVLAQAEIALLFEAADALGETRDNLRLGMPAADATLSAVLQRAGENRTPVSDVAAVAAPVVAAVGVDPHHNERRTGQVRVSLQHVDAITSAAGEIAGLAAILEDRADALAALRARRRAERRGVADVDVDRMLSGLLRSAGEDARAIAAVSGRLGVAARHLRQRPFSELTETLPRVARDVARDSGKQVRLVVTGATIEADRVVLEALREPLLHLVRNAVDHGLELPAERVAARKDPEGEVRIEGALRGDRLQITIADDGHGLDLDAVRRGLVRRGRAVPVEPDDLAQTVFDEGFSTRETATTLSGRGVGLGIVRAAAERLGGTAVISSVTGQGARITIDVPVSIATMRVVLVEVSGMILGLPSAFVVRVDRVDPRTLGRVNGRTMLPQQERPTPVTTLAALLGPPFQESTVASTVRIVVLESGGKRLAVVVDDLIDERELVLRPLEHAGSAATNATVGTVILGTGVVTLVLSVPALLTQGEGGGHGAHSSVLAAGAVEARPPARILVVDDSITSRTLEQSVLAAAGYDVLTAVDGAEGWRTIQQNDLALVVSDVEMPHLDGVALCERVRADSRTASLPFILVTSLDEPAQRARGLAAGADAYITKSSFDQDTLLDTVLMLLGRNSGGTQ